MALHRALLEWLIQGNLPDLLTRGCLNQGILPPQGTRTCPYDCLGIEAANLLVMMLSHWLSGANRWSHS
jgi:hypothetical protein